MRPRTLWIVHLTTLLGLVLWSMMDLRFESFVRPLLNSFPPSALTLQQADEIGGLYRIVLLGIVALGAAGSLSLLVMNLFRSHWDTRVRSIASLLAITTTVALWFSFALNYSSFAWQGKRARLGLQVEKLEAIVQPLRDDWPQRDGDTPGLGPFMAYPFGQPTTLILLQSPPLAGQELSVLKWTPIFGPRARFADRPNSTSTIGFAGVPRTSSGQNCLYREALLV